MLNNVPILNGTQTLPDVVKFYKVSKIRNHINVIYENEVNSIIKKSLKQIQNYFTKYMHFDDKNN